MIPNILIFLYTLRPESFQSSSDMFDPVTDGRSQGMSLRAEEWELAGKGCQRCQENTTHRINKIARLGTQRDCEHLHGSEVGLCIYGMVKQLGILVGLLRVEVGVASDAFTCS